MQRLILHARLSPSLILTMVVYIDRLCGHYPDFTIDSFTIHRFLVTAATVASKALSDELFDNPTYAWIGGISTSELAVLELEFLKRMKWEVVPKADALIDYYWGLLDWMSMLCG